MIKIVRYNNRKYYDKGSHKYVNLKEIQDMVKQGKTVNVTEKETSKDITYLTLVRVLNSKLSDKEFPSNENIINLIKTV